MANTHRALIRYQVLLKMKMGAYVQTHFILGTGLRGRCHDCSHFPDEEPEAQRLRDLVIRDKVKSAGPRARLVMCPGHKM